MRYFAEIDSENKVARVIVLADNKDETWLTNVFGGSWVEGYQGGGSRKNYPGVGFLYDPDRDGFIPPKPEQFTSWILNEKTLTWEPPIELPDLENDYAWDEENTSWILIEP